MKRLYSYTRANKVARAAQSKAFLLLRLLPVLACTLAAPLAATAQESTADVCRKTKEVSGQYERENLEISRLIYIKQNLDLFRERLSSLRNAIANNAVDSDLPFLAVWLGFVDINSKTNKQKQELQPQIRVALEKAIQTARDSNIDDLYAQSERIHKQIKLRGDRWLALNCHEVLAREKSSSTSATGCGVGKVWHGVESGHSMTWKRIGDSNQFIVEGTVNGQKFTAKQDIFIAGNKVTINRFQASDGNTCNFTGTINGGTASGTYTCTKYKPSSGWRATIDCN